MERPNIIVVLADDLGYGDMSCYGAQRFRTTHMDYVAERGIRFTDMHSTSAVCTPSRYGLLTGRYCWRTWLKSFVLGGFGSPLIEPERLTLPGMLGRAGYRTAAIGKWHLGLDWQTSDGKPLRESDKDGWNTDGFDVDYSKGFAGGPTEVGFESWYGIAGSLDMPPYCYLEDSGVPTIPTKEKSYYYPQQRRGLQSEDFVDEEVDLKFAERAEQFIDKHSASKEESPFFLYVTPVAPHRPCVPPDWLQAKSNAGLREDMVLMVDHLVGRIVAALDRNGFAENTLLIVTSDNGARLVNYDGKDHGHKSNGDLRGGKGDIYDGGHREPLVAMWPKVVRPGSVSDELLSLADIFATCAEIVDYPLPDEAAEDSFSFLPILEGASPKEPIREAVVHHALDGMFAVRMGPWKMILGTGSGGFSEPQRYEPREGEPTGQLYNTADDLRETRNLWKERPDIVEQFRAVLTRYQKEGRSRPR